MTGDDALVDHMIERQIKPQLIASAVGGTTLSVSTDPDHQGTTITCGGCGRTSKLPGPMPKKREGQVIPCPDCLS